MKSAYYRLAFVAALIALLGESSAAEEPAAREAQPAACDVPPPGETGPGWRRLLPDSHAWIDRAGKRVVMDGRVCLREGPLEMFACLEKTKEHESIIAVRTMAFAVHAALVAIGAEAGGVAQFDPEFRPPHGDEIDVYVAWVADEKLHCVRAQEWIRQAKSGHAMDKPFVFAGSQLWKDSVTGRRRYLAEEGDFICVSNFASAMLDVPFASTDSAEGLLFMANTEAIPPIDTPVRMILAPKLKAAETNDEGATPSSSATKP